MAFKGQPPCLQTYCSHREWRGFKKTLIMHGGLHKRPRHCLASLRTAQNSGGGLERSPAPPPHLQTQCSHGWFQQKTHMLSSKLAQAEGWWGAAPPPPRLQTHRSHGEWRGFKRTHIMHDFIHDPEAVKQACTRFKTAGGGGMVGVKNTYAVK